MQYLNGLPKTCTSDCKLLAAVQQTSRLGILPLPSLLHKHILVCSVLPICFLRCFSKPTPSLVHHSSFQSPFLACLYMHAILHCSAAQVSARYLSAAAQQTCAMQTVRWMSYWTLPALRQQHLLVLSLPQHQLLRLRLPLQRRIVSKACPACAGRPRLKAASLLRLCKKSQPPHNLMMRRGMLMRLSVNQVREINSCTKWLKLAHTAQTTGVCAKTALPSQRP